MNTTNFKLVLDKIKSDPTCWRQSSWHCGTQHCFAGWAQILSGHPANDVTVRRDARIFLDLSYLQADYLFSTNATIADFEDALSIGIDGFNRAGYDCAGYDRAGYDCAGFNRAGFNRAGFNRAGFNRAGYDCDGLDKNNQPRPTV